MPTLEATAGHVYDYPQYYDLIFAADWKDEFRFLENCFLRFAARRVRRLFEPACGTGRLLIKLAQAGYQVAGNDLNSKAVDFCNARLQRAGFRPTARVGDMSSFRLARPVDAGFNLINSFRHLATDAAAESHLRCMAEVIASGGLYLLGLHLTPPGPRACDEEAWVARRGGLRVASRMWTIEVDNRRRQERVGMTYDVTTSKRQFRLRDEFPLRTYTRQQMSNLLARVPEFEVLQTYDFNHDIESPISINAATEDVVYVLRRQ